MLEIKDDKCYQAWRRSEAYMVPVSKEGMELANKRYREFKKGWDYGVKAAILELEKEHSLNKKTHSFFNLAKDIVSKLRIN